MMADTFVHIHIGKTAGTSLRTILQNSLGQMSCSPPFVQKYMTEDEAKYYRPFPVISGHISRSDQTKYFSSRKLLTILREPIDRCFSFIHYVGSIPANSAPIAADARRLSVLELIDTVEARRNVFNTMVRQLGGHMLDEPDDFPALLEQAKSTLREAFWVGRQGTLPDDLAKLRRMLGIDLTVLHQNKTPGRPPVDLEDVRVRNRLLELNVYDLKLWDWANQELFR